MINEATIVTKGEKIFLQWTENVQITKYPNLLTQEEEIELAKSGQDSRLK